MAPIPRGFGGRRRDGIDPSPIPPGQYYERGFLVLSAGPTPRTPLDEWTFSTRSPSSSPLSKALANTGPDNPGCTCSARAGLPSSTTP